VTRIGVDTDRLAEFLERLRLVQADLGATEHAVAARIRAVQAGWAGPAAAAQEAAHQQWQDGARQVQDALATLHSILRTAQDNYAAAISANQRVWRT